MTSGTWRYTYTYKFFFFFFYTRLRIINEEIFFFSFLIATEYGISIAASFESGTRARAEQFILSLFFSPLLSCIRTHTTQPDMYTCTFVIPIPVCLCVQRERKKERFTKYCGNVARSRLQECVSRAVAKVFFLVH